MSCYDGVTAAELARRLGAPCCLVFERVGSTLDVVHELAAEGAPAGTVVLADEQLAGRGRQGRSWHSPRGAGVWLGYLARPVSGAGHGVTALRVGLALADTLATMGIAAGIKWPNDLMLGERKAGGILCEARWSGGRLGWLAIGVGVNVHGPLPAALGDGAIALDRVAPTVTRVTLLERFVPRLGALPYGSELTDDELRAFHKHDRLAGRLLEQPVRGVARGIDAEGSLVVETDAGVERIRGGSVVPA